MAKGKSKSIISASLIKCTCNHFLLSLLNMLKTGGGLNLTVPLKVYVVMTLGVFLQALEN